MTLQDHALRLIERNCLDLDPSHPFMLNSPMVGIRHGDYRFRMGSEPDSPALFKIFLFLSATA